jgi:hypothetical protein
MSFRVLARLAEIDVSSSLRNALLAEILIDGHFAIQVLTVRRLMDYRPDVISLPRLLRDLKANIHLFTRENFVCHDGLPYDYEEAERRVWASRTGKGPFWGPTTGPDAYGTSEIMHNMFDRLTGAAPESRTREDQIPDRIVDKLSEWLNNSGSDQIVVWSHKFLAHGADAASRRNVDLAAIRPALDKHTNALRVFARVAEAAGMLLGSGLGQYVPTAQFDKLDRLPEWTQPQLDEYWEQLTSERENFTQGVLEDLIKR